MHSMTEHINAVRSTADTLYSAEEVELAAQGIAETITPVLSEKDPILLCVMNGAVISTALIMAHLHFPLRQDYVHATRYRSGTRGGELQWKQYPGHALEGQHVLVIDDIFDEGTTLEMIVDYCQGEGAASVHSAVLVEKLRDRNCSYRPDFIGLEVPDRYVFGSGMDYKEYLRNAPGILAVADEFLT